MKWLAMALIVLGVGLWAVVNTLSSDAIGLFLGLLFGILAGVPSALLMLVTARRNAPERSPFRQPPPQPPAALLPGPVTLVLDNGDGRRVQVQFADPSAAQRFLADYSS